MKDEYGFEVACDEWKKECDELFRPKTKAKPDFWTRFARWLTSAPALKRWPLRRELGPRLSKLFGSRARAKLRLGS